MSSIEFRVADGGAFVPGQLILEATDAEVRLYALVRCLGQSGTYRSKESVAEALGWGTSKLYETAKRLRERGWLAMTSTRRSDGTQTSTWTVQAYSAQAESLRSGGVPTPPQRSPYSAQAERGTSTSPPHQAIDHLPVTEPSKETRRHPSGLTKAQRDEAFAEFWATYPRKVGKKAARASWERAIRSVDPQSLMACLRRSEALRSRERQYIPHPTTWLNQGRWDDEDDTTTAKPVEVRW